MTSSPSNRFRRNNRLVNAAAFDRVFDRPTRSRDNLFTVLCRPNDTGTARLGLAISKKRCRRSTARNRIKRIVRESFRQQHDLLSGLDVVVMNNPGAVLASNVEMFESLDGHWARCRQAKTEGPQANG